MFLDSPAVSADAVKALAAASSLMRMMHGTAELGAASKAKGATHGLLWFPTFDPTAGSRMGPAFVVGVGGKSGGNSRFPFGNDRKKCKSKSKSKGNGSRGSFDCVGRKVRVQLRSR